MSRPWAKGSASMSASSPRISATRSSVASTATTTIQPRIHLRLRCSVHSHGLKASYAFNSRISSALMVTNGCDAVTRLNGGVTFGGQFAAVTSKNTTLTFNFLHGPEQPHNDHDQRGLYELTGSWKVMPRLALAFDGLYADEDHAARDGSDAIWKGFAGYSKYTYKRIFSRISRRGLRRWRGQPHRHVANPPRLHRYARICFARQYLAPELLHFAIDGKFVTRGEFRQDLSDHATFRRAMALPHASSRPPST